jgi:hypothetical protein
MYLYYICQTRTDYGILKIENLASRAAMVDLFLPGESTRSESVLSDCHTASDDPPSQATIRSLGVSLDQEEPFMCLAGANLIFLYYYPSLQCPITCISDHLSQSVIKEGSLARLANASRALKVAWNVTCEELGPERLAVAEKVKVLQLSFSWFCN